MPFYFFLEAMMDLLYWLWYGFGALRIVVGAIGLFYIARSGLSNSEE